jgi:hypothetical protein
MSFTTLTPVEKINRHLTLLGYAGSNLHKTILKWDNANGSDWTVDRLKTLKVQFLHLVAKQPFDKDWIAYKGDFPRGPFGTLFKYGLKKPRRCLAVLNSYMSYTSPSLKKQHDVIQNITNPMTREVQRFVDDQFMVISLNNSTMHYGRKLFKHLTVDNIRPSVSTALNTAKPFVGNDGNQWLESLRYTSRRILPTEGISCHFYDKNTLDVERYGGELVVLPEKGNKARVIALPHAELQVFLKPLHDTLAQILEYIPEDCTRNQISGAKYAQQCLKEGKMVHSVDLSAATDRFPLRLQMGLLRKFLPDPGQINWASFFERSAQLKWKTTVFGDVIYGAGQPMGLYGSFSMFALTHHAILHTLSKQIGIMVNDQGTLPYRILGDDIIISDDLLAEAYKAYIKKIGVEISKSKTISSSSAAEFAGFLITRKSCIKAAKPIGKGMTVDNMINYIQTLGSNPFRGELRDLGDLLMNLPAPYGAGINPHGLSKQTRLYFYMSGMLEEKVLSAPENIDGLLYANRREHKYWNPYLRQYDETMEPTGPDVVLNYFADVMDQIRTELDTKRNNIGDSRYHREQMLNSVDGDKTLAYAGSLGQQHRVVKPDEYVSKKLSWYKKLFSFYPWKT